MTCLEISDLVYTCLHILSNLHTCQWHAWQIALSMTCIYHVCTCFCQVVRIPDEGSTRSRWYVLVQASTYSSGYTDKAIVRETSICFIFFWCHCAWFSFALQVLIFPLVSRLLPSIVQLSHHHQRPREFPKKDSTYLFLPSYSMYLVQLNALIWNPTHPAKTCLYLSQTCTYNLCTML